MQLLKRATQHLRFGRVSIVGARYFVTLCCQARGRVLTETTNGTRILTALERIRADGDAEINAATIMPDHVHLLFTLGDRIKYGQVIGKFKSFAREQGGAAWHWQQDGFEHRLRPEESSEGYGFYIFMNPYVKKLCDLSQRWPWWVCKDPSRFEFASSLERDPAIPPEWLGKYESVKSKIVL